MKYTIAILTFVLCQLPVWSQSQQYFVNKTYVLKGKGAENEKSEIGPVYPGDEVTVLHLEENMMDPENDWAKVRVSDGKEGYIPFPYLQKNKPDESIIRKREVILFQPQKYYVTASSLMLRSGPGQHFDAISSLHQNMEVEVSKFSDNDDYIDGYAAKWAYLKVNDYMEGWVYSAYLSMQKASSDQSPEPWEHINSGSSKYVRPPVLRIRDEPGKLGGIIGTVPQGQNVQIIERKEWVETISGIRSIWVKIRVGQVEGFVFGGFLSTRAGLVLRSDDIDKPFIYPIDPNRSRRTSPYGNRIHPISKLPRLHTGMDIGAPTGVPIYAAGDGVVEFQEDKTVGGYGRLTVLRHDNGLVTYYAHQDVMFVRRGDRVKAGDTIGNVGNTGNSTGPHLHFEVRAGLHKESFDPENFMDVP